MTHVDNLSEEEFEDTKGIIRIEEEQTTQWSKEKNKMSNNDLQNVYT